MSIKPLFKNNKFMLRIYLFVFIAFFFLVTVFSIVIFNNIGSIVLESENKNNKKILSQLKSNIEFMDNTIKNICMYLHVSDDVIYIMYDHNPDISELVTKVNKLRKTIPSTNPFVHSMYIYNRNIKSFYSTYKGLYYNDPTVDDIINSKNIPILKPILRKIEPEYDRQTDIGYVFTYFMYERNSKNILNDMMVVNVKPEWLIENIMNIYKSNPDDGEYILIYNNKGEYIGNKSNDPDFNQKLEEVYSEYVSKSSAEKENSEYIIKRVGNQEYIYTFLYIEKLDMLLVKTQKYNVIFEFINKIKFSIILITVIFIVLSFFVLFYLSRAIYKPVGKLVSHIVSQNPSKDVTPSKDEITYLNDVYVNIIDGLNQYEVQRLSYKEEMKKQCLKKILYNSSADDIVEFGKELHENNINIRIDRDIVFCIVSVDNTNEFRNKFNSKDRGLLKFCVINICEEIISASFSVNGVDIEDNGRVVLILNSEGAGPVFYDRLITLIKECQDKIKEYLKITVTITISQIISKLTDANEEYMNVLNNSSYKYIFGRNSIITTEMIEGNNRNLQHEISSELKKKLEEEIRGGNLIKIEKVLDKIIGEISQFNYDNVIVSAILILNIIKNTTDEINRMSLKPIVFDLASISKNIFEAETIEDFKITVMNSLKTIVELKESVGIEDRHNVLINNIKDIVKAEFGKSNLCIDEIAAALKMSSRYIGRMFKEITGMTIGEYINDVRMDVSAELLKSTNMSVIEISGKVGIENDTYFYSLFKKKYGVTPKEYAVKSSTGKA